MLQQLRKIFISKTKEKVGSPVEGEAVPIKDVSDPTFKDEILGKGIAIRPEKGRAVSPVDGTVTVLIESNHAVSILSDSGAEILVHIGLDTINLQGQFYTAHVKVGDHVKAGDLLIEFDLEGIKNAGYDTITPVVILNSNEYTDIELIGEGQVKEQDVLMRLVK